jgi:protein-disulfide isomerase
MTTSKLTLPVSDRDHIQGPATALVTLVEYGDYECPHCGAAYPVIETIRRKFGDRLRFVFRHFPLTGVHPHAEGAAEAAEAAGAQNHFWQMHHLLMTNQDMLSPSNLIHHAGRLGLDTDWFGHALAAHTFRDRVREDFMSGVRGGVNGTPTFFINGARHDGPASLPALSHAIEELLS